MRNLKSYVFRSSVLFLSTKVRGNYRRNENRRTGILQKNLIFTPNKEQHRMLTQAFFDAVFWHLISVWAEVIKSLMHMIPSLVSNVTVDASPNSDAYKLEHTVLTVFIAIATTVAGVTVTCVVFQTETRYRTRPKRNTTRTKLKAIVHTVPTHDTHLVPIPVPIPGASRTNVSCRDTISSRRRV